MTFKPMLAAKAPDGSALRFPLLASPKLDGIRCCIVDGVPMSRNLKPIPNRFIRERISWLPFFDGELIVGNPTGADVWNRSNSGVMSRDGESDFTFHVFDLVDHPGDFLGRLERAREWITGANAPCLSVESVDHHTVWSAAELDAFEAKCLAAGYEGVMLRDPAGPYKHGRSTAREGWLMKLKRFEDHEAIVTGVVEQMHNGNEATRDELGRAKRSTHAAGKTGKGTLGALSCAYGGITFELGTGFDDATRAALWQSPPIGAAVTFKCQGFTPGDGKPRFPVFKGLRLDISEAELLS